jgi:hypothetical protein
MQGQSPRNPRSVYTAVFLIGFATLTIEIAFTRLLSVISYYHLAFFAVSTAMLGMTAGAVTVFTRAHVFNEQRLFKTLAQAGSGFALSAVVSALAVCLIPIGLEGSQMKIIGLLALTFFCSLPFYFSGIIVTALLTRTGFQVPKIYGFDLIGASFGCLFVLAGLNFFDAVSLIIFSGSAGVAAYFIFSARTGSANKAPGILLLFFILLLSFSNRFTRNGIRPLIVKGKVEVASDHLLEKWNSFSRVLVFQKKNAPPQLWGASPVTPPQLLEQYHMSIDGDAATVVRRFTSPADGEHLKYDLTALAYYLRDSARTCVIGVGGGKDIQTAICFGSRQITGIDINPVFIDLLKNRFGSFTGIARHPEVSLHLEEARSYLSHTKEQYDIIQMSLVDTWAATGAGAFSLSENNLYTVEAWKTFLSRLSDSGLLTVSRWYNPSNLGETGRLLSLAVAASLASGIREPEKHIALVTINNLATLILSRQAFSEADIFRLQQKTGELRFHPVLIPGQATGDPLLNQIVRARSLHELNEAVKGSSLNYTPPTDENPYFFNMLKLTDLKFKTLNTESGIMKGNLQATITLLLLIACLLAVAVATIAVPLFLKTKANGRTAFNRAAISGALYFCLIGAGFMLVEIALVQRLSVFLGHPVYGLGILLFSMILSTGAGSLLVEKVVVRKWLRLYPVIAACCVLGIGLLVPVVMSNMMVYAIWQKALISVLMIFPLGFCLGWFFPIGMQMARGSQSALTPWYWALNGIFGVLFSAIAVLISIYAGISVNFYIGALVYASLVFIARRPGS